MPRKFLMLSMIVRMVGNLKAVRWAQSILPVALLMLVSCCELEAREVTIRTDADTPTEATLSTPDTVTKVSILMDADDWNQLRHTARSTEVIIPVCGSGPGESPYEYLPATVTVDGVRLENVGVRAKGFVGSINPARPSLIIKFDEFVEDQTLGAMERMTLNNNNQDFSRMRTCLALRMFQKAGLPAPDCSFAHLTVNGEDLGVYASVEPIRKPFLRKHFADHEGNLYEAQLGDFVPELINSFERKTNQSTAADRSDLEAVMFALEDDDTDLLTAVDAVIDLDAFFGFWAMEILISHWDGYTGNQNNYYIYSDPTTGKFFFIPWGPDAAFSEKEDVLHINSVGPLFANSALSKRLYDHPEGRRRFGAKLTELYSLVWGDDELLNHLRELRKVLKPYVLPDLKRRFGFAVVDLHNFMITHAQTVYTTIIEPAEAPEYPFPLIPRCVEELPPTHNFEISFSTAWGTFPGYGIGEVDRFEVPGIDEQFYSAAASKTFVPVLPGLGNVTININGYKFLSTTTNGMSINMSAYQFLSGEDIVTNNLATPAFTYRLPNFFDPTNVELTGIVTNGVLSLDEAGMNPGDAVSGTFRGEIIAFPQGYLTNTSLNAYRGD